MKALAIGLAVLFVICAIVAFLHPLPGSGVTDAIGFSNDRPHTKHGVLYIVLALLCLVWYRFQSNTDVRTVR